MKAYVTYCLIVPVLGFFVGRTAGLLYKGLPLIQRQKIPPSDGPAGRIHWTIVWQVLGFNVLWYEV